MLHVFSLRVLYSLDQRVNNLNELENLRIAELLQYQKHVYAPMLKEKGREVMERDEKR